MKVEIHKYDIVESSIKECKRLLEEKKCPVAVVASKMTHGEGRFGQTWHSESDENLHLSMGWIVDSDIGYQEMSSLNIWAGIEICKALQKFIPEKKLELRWVNDIYCNNKKISGMYQKSLIQGGKVRKIVFSVGLNINSDPKSYPPTKQLIATSLKQELGKELDMEAVTKEVIESVTRAFERVENKESHVGPFDKLDGLKEKKIFVVKEEITGIAKGINSFGFLLVKTNEGIEKIHSPDVVLENEHILSKELKTKGCHFYLAK